MRATASYAQHRDQQSCFASGRARHSVRAVLGDCSTARSGVRALPTQRESKFELGKSARRGGTMTSASFKAPISGGKAALLLATR